MGYENRPYKSSHTNIKMLAAIVGRVSPPSVQYVDVANVALLIQFAKYWRYLLMLSEASFLTMQKRFSEWLICKNPPDNLIVRGMGIQEENIELFEFSCNHSTAKSPSSSSMRSN